MPQAPVTLQQQVQTAVRMFMRDLPAYSKRFAGKPIYTEEELRFAVMMSMERINTILPLTYYTVEDTPFKSWLVRMTAAMLMEMRMHEVERELINVTDPGGISISREELTGLRRVVGSVPYLEKEISSGKAAIQMSRWLGSCEGISSVYNFTSAEGTTDWGTGGDLDE